MSCRLLLASGGVSPCQQRLSFSCWILAYLRKTLLESSEIFVEHTPQGARIWFRTQACACDSGLGHVHRIINKWMLALEKVVWRERTRLTSPKVWAAVTWQKGLTWFRQSNRHLAFYQALESRLRRIGINGHFLCLIRKVTHNPHFVSFHPQVICIVEKS